MQSYKCPNCGRVYNYGNSVDIMIQCMNCGYPLKKAEEVKTVKHPELNPMLSNSHVIGRIQDPTKPIVTCPYCKSTNTTKISGISKAGSVMMFGIFSQKVKKQWHCNNCNSDF